MKRIITILVLSTFAFLSCNGSDTEKAQIRENVEKLSIQSKLSDHCDIYCALSVRDAYRINGYAPFWKDDRQINEFVRIIKECEDEGLHPDDYQLSLIELLRSSKLPEARVQLDIVLTDTFLLYASHLYSGKTHPVTIGAKWHITESARDIVNTIFDMNTKGVLTVVSEIQPKSSNYVGLKSKLNAYRALKDKEIAWGEIDPNTVIKPGTADDLIFTIRDRLQHLGDFAEGGNIYSNYYDAVLKRAVMRFQGRHGLDATGIIGQKTIDALNTPIQERIKTIEVNLERLRWLPQTFSQYYVMVNIADYHLDVVRNNLVIKSHKVIIGRPFRQTPVLSSTLKYLVFNPTWTVPPTIRREDLIPAIRKSRTYLSKKNIQVFDRNGEVLNPNSIDWESSAIYGYTYRQKPGVNNALGLVKFIFPNNFSVYLHDTPGKELFRRSERSFSSGCIRVENALEFADFLLSDQPEYDRQAIHKIIQSSKTKRVNLKSKPDVYLLYLTAWVTDSRELNFRKDIYGRDDRLYKALYAKPALNK